MSGIRLAAAYSLPKLSQQQIIKLTTMKKVIFFVMCFVFSSYNSFSQDGRDSIVIALKKGDIYKLDISKKEDLKIYHSIFEQRDNIKSCEKKGENGSVYIIAETMPVSDDFRTFIMKNLKYPRQAKEDGIKGKVYVQFVITESGEVKFAKILKGDNDLLNNEALRLILSCPRWKPGIVNNKPVNVEFVIPITFE